MLKFYKTDVNVLKWSNLSIRTGKYSILLSKAITLNLRKRKRKSFYLVLIELRLLSHKGMTFIA